MAVVDAKDTGPSIAISLGFGDLEKGTWLEIGVTSDFDRVFITSASGDPSIGASSGAVDRFDDPNGVDDLPEEGFGGGLGNCLAVGTLALLRR